MENKTALKPKLTIESNVYQKHCMLWQVSIGDWSNNRQSKTATKHLEKEFKIDNGKNGGSSSRVRAYTSAIDPIHLKPMQKIINSFRTWIYENTLPYNREKGKVILTTAMYSKAEETKRQFVADFEEEKRHILSNFTNWQQEAKRDLGKCRKEANCNGTCNCQTLYNPKDYPDIGDLADKYYYSFKYHAIPASGHFQADILQSAIDDIQADLERDNNETIKEAMLSNWHRIHKAVSKLSEAMKKTKKDKQGNEITGTFRDSITGNIHELIDILPALNITDCPELEKMRKTLQDTISGIDPEDLRQSEDLRKDLASKADSIIENIAGIF